MILICILSRIVCEILCSINQIIAFDKGCLSLINSFSETSENIVISHILLNTRFCFILPMGTRIWIDSVMHPRSSSRGRNTSASVTLTVTVWTAFCHFYVIGPKTAKVGRITQNNGHCAIQGKRFWSQSKAHMQLPVSD